MTELIDTHAHLDAEQLAPDLPAVLARARAAGVVQVVAVGITAASSQRCRELAAAEPGVFASAGIHPNEAHAASPGDWDAVVALASLPRVVGVGETGLDRHWHDTPFPLQEDYFRRHLELGRRLGKPVVVHCREAEEDVVRLLREAYDRHGPVRGVMHSFAGAWATAEACLAMGLCLSFSGTLTYKNAQGVRDVAARAPVDRVMVETDCPYLSPVPLRGKRNEPANVAHTAACLAGVWGRPVEEVAAVTTRNARGLFGLGE